MEGNMMMMEEMDGVAGRRRMKDDFLSGKSK